MVSAYLNGFVVCGGLIIAIGAQNAFVLAQGLKKRHVFAVALICSLYDALYITAGIAGVGSFFASNAVLQILSAFGGAIFLFAYGILSFRSAIRGGSLEASETEGFTLKKIFVMLTLLTVLNPHVYIDTILLLGGISSKYTDSSRLYFGIGAVSASFVWFFSLSYGAGFLAPIFRKPISWRVLDTAIGTIMLSIAVSLVMFGLKLT